MGRSRFGGLLLVHLAVVLLALPSNARANSSPVVTNVVAQQLSGTGQVRITYDVSDADGDQLAASLVCSSNNGASFDLYPVTVSGDIRLPMAPGPGKQIIWNAAADYPGRFWSQVVAKVVVSDGPSIATPMLLVAAGAFSMGGNDAPGASPVHTVTLDPFYIDKSEVTNAEFEAFINAGGYTTQAYWSEAGWLWRSTGGITAPANWGVDGYRSGPSWPGFPVAGVSWYEAEAYARFVGKRLPTEAEWEKAARGTDSRLLPYGDVLSSFRVNYSNSSDPFEQGATPVEFYDGRLHPSPAFQTTDSPGPYGAYDQAGNVAEWTQDWFDEGYYAVSPGSNPAGPTQGNFKVVRGGSWADNPAVGGGTNYVHRTYYRSTLSYISNPSLRSEILGFRCARNP